MKGKKKNKTKQKVCLTKKIKLELMPKLQLTTRDILYNFYYLEMESHSSLQEEKNIRSKLKTLNDYLISYLLSFLLIKLFFILGNANYFQFY